jgi:hypothetical protein
LATRKFIYKKPLKTNEVAKTRLPSHKLILLRASDFRSGKKGSKDITAKG